MEKISDAENEARMLRGEMYTAFTPSLVAKRRKAAQALHNFNTAHGASRRELVELWKVYVNSTILNSYLLTCVQCG